jgi:hypothetical protein
LPSGTSAASTFDVFVTPDLDTTCGVGAPLRNEAPYSAHKRTSTIPHKICLPAYADGSLATDLASGLRLTLKKTDNGSEVYEQTTSDDYSAGSTEQPPDSLASLGAAIPA